MCLVINLIIIQIQITQDLLFCRKFLLIHCTHAGVKLGFVTVVPMAHDQANTVINIFFFRNYNTGVHKYYTYYLI